MTLYFETWQLIVVCLLTIIGAAVVALVLVGLLGAWLFRDRGSVPVARAVAEPAGVAPRTVTHGGVTYIHCDDVEASGVTPRRVDAFFIDGQPYWSEADVAAAQQRPAGSVRLHAVHDRDACDACAGRDRGSF